MLPLATLPSIVYAADAAIRQSASFGEIVSERDYVTAWLTTAKNIWRMLGGRSFCKTLNFTNECRIGADIIFVIGGPSFYKYFYLEAKRLLPDFDKNKKNASAAAMAIYGVGPGTQVSRFSDQLARQQAWIAGHAGDVICEIFLHFPGYFCGPPGYDFFGSTLVRQASASAGLPGGLSTNVWHLVNVDAIVMPPASFSIMDFLTNIVNCNIAHPINNEENPPGYGMNDDIFPMPNMNGFDLENAMRVLGVNQYFYFEGNYPIAVEDAWRNR